MIAKGEVEMGFYNVSEIPEGKGLQFAGPFLRLCRSTRLMRAALMSDGSEPQAARAFIQSWQAPRRAHNGSPPISSRPRIVNR